MMSPKKLMDLFYPPYEKIIVNFLTMADHYIDLYEELVNNEINLANISNSDHILHIGCGALPATSILLVKKVGSSIVAIEKDNKSCRKAIRYLIYRGFADKIQIKNKDALSLDCSLETYTVIIISRGVAKTETLLEYIHSNIKPGTRVILRIPSTHGKKYKNIISNIFLEKGSVTSYGTTTSVLLLSK